MTTISNAVEPVIIERLYKHSPDKVFKAFSNRASFEQWIAPTDDIGTRILLYDFKVGGHYRIEFSIPNAGTLFLKGEYVHIKRPNQICFTWVWEEPDVHAGIDSLVTVNFLEHKNFTKLVITHEKLSLTQANARHTQGWNGALTRLENFLNLPLIQQD